MEDQKDGFDPTEISRSEESSDGGTQEGIFESQVVNADVEPARAARAKLIEETTYQLTDLFTVVSARIDIVSERATGPCQQDLLAIRNVITKGMELNQRLQVVARACRRAISS